MANSLSLQARHDVRDFTLYSNCRFQLRILSFNGASVKMPKRKAKDSTTEGGTETPRRSSRRLSSSQAKGQANVKGISPPAKKTKKNKAIKKRGNDVNEEEEDDKQPVINPPSFISSSCRWQYPA
jgi:hypothetical protein